VSSFADLTSPPSDLPTRATGLVFGHAGGETNDTVDVEYNLVSTSEVDHITAFTGPQLSFEFDVPQFAEDALAGHITTTGVPWNQPRYEEPAADITDSNHRGTLAERYDVIGEPASVNSVIANISEAVASDDAPEDEGLTTQTLSTEGVALLESDPEAVPTFGGVAVLQDVPEGDHRLTVNAAGVEPHSETVAVADSDSGPTAAGVDGRIPVVARENATKFEVDAEGSDSGSRISPSRTISPGESTTPHSRDRMRCTSIAAGPTRQRSGIATTKSVPSASIPPTTRGSH